MKNRITLFHPGYVHSESQTFTIDYGKQMTIAAIGLEPGDTINFEMLHVPAIDPDNCVCPPGSVELPSVAAYSMLQCCGTLVELNIANPVVILDNPQRMLLRAVLNTSDPDSIWVWAIETATPDLTSGLRGCNCEDGGVQA